MAPAEIVPIRSLNSYSCALCRHFPLNELLEAWWAQLGRPLPDWGISGRSAYWRMLLPALQREPEHIGTSIWVAVLNPKPHVYRPLLSRGALNYFARVPTSKPIRTCLFESLTIRD